METCIKQLTQKKSDVEYEKLLSEAKQFSENNTLYYSNFKEIRRRSKKKMHGENSVDEVLSSSKNKYKCDTYFKVLDEIITSIHTRFNDSHEIMKDLALLSPERIAFYSNKNKTLPSDSFNKLGTWIQNLNIEQFKNEYKTFAKCFNELISSFNLPSVMN
jgi:hypothetical protein